MRREKQTVFKHARRQPGPHIPPIPALLEGGTVDVGRAHRFIMLCLRERSSSLRLEAESTATATTTERQQSIQAATTTTAAATATTTTTDTATATATASKPATAQKGQQIHPRE